MGAWRKNNSSVGQGTLDNFSRSKINNSNINGLRSNYLESNDLWRYNRGFQSRLPIDN